MTNRIYARSALAEPGTVTHHGYAMRYAHGTAGGYGADRCRCRDCCLIGSMVPAERTAEHLAELKAGGVLRTYIGADIGMSTRNLDQIAGGGTRQVRQLTAELVATLVHKYRLGALPADAYRTAEAPPAQLTVAPGPSPVVNDFDELLAGLRDAVERRTPGWRDLAACAGTSPAVFFPKVDPAGNATKNHRAYNAARRYCAGCPVRDDCLAEHLDEKHGYVGGTTPHERQRLRSASQRATAAVAV